MFKKLLQNRIYADAAAATPLSSRARKELVRLLGLYGNPGGLHAEAYAAKQELAHARETVATAIGGHADEIIFTASGTEANNLALQGVLRPLLAKHGEVGVLTSKIEHASVLEPLRALEREGAYVTELEVDEQGMVSVDALKDAVTDETALISIQLINSEVGTIQPIKEIVKMVRQVRTLRQAQGKKQNEEVLPLCLHTDASQAPLWMRLQVESLGVDMLTIDGQKIYGPKGVGGLYVRRGVPLEPLLWGGMQEGGYRAGTENVPLVGSFAVSLADAQARVDVHTAHTTEVRDYLRDLLKKTFPDAQIHGAFGKERVANNVNVSIPGLPGEMAVIALDKEGVAASTRSACSTGEETISHVLEALGISQKTALEAVRITLLPSATKRDARHIVKALERIARVYRAVV